MKLYKKLGELYPVVEDNLKYIFNGTEITPESLESFGYIEYTETPIIIEETIELTQEEKIELWVRRARDVLLKESDWTQVADVSLTAEQKAAWLTYRQALRDLTTTLANIQTQEDVVLPTKPQ
jgi:hypothetical protein